MIIFLEILIAVTVIYFIASPFFTEDFWESDSVENTNLESLKDQKTRFLQMLRDLELDYATAKLSEADYVQTKDELSQEFSEILKQIDQAEK